MVAGVAAFCSHLVKAGRGGKVVFALPRWGQQVEVGVDVDLLAARAVPSLVVRRGVVRRALISARTRRPVGPPPQQSGGSGPSRATDGQSCMCSQPSPSQSRKRRMRSKTSGARPTRQQRKPRWSCICAARPATSGGFSRTRTGPTRCGIWPRASGSPTPRREPERRASAAGSGCT